MTKQEADMAAALNVLVRRRYSEAGRYRISEVCKIYPDEIGRERGKKAEIMIRMEDEHRRVVTTYPENIMPVDEKMWETLKSMQNEKTEKTKEEAISQMVSRKIREIADYLNETDMDEESASVLYEEYESRYRDAKEFMGIIDMYVEKEGYKLYLQEKFGLYVSEEEK